MTYRNPANEAIVESIVNEFTARLNTEGFGSALDLYKARRHEVSNTEDRAFHLAPAIEHAHLEYTEQSAASRAERLQEISAHDKAAAHEPTTYTTGQFEKDFRKGEKVATSNLTHGEFTATVVRDTRRWEVNVLVRSDVTGNEFFVNKKGVDKV